MAEKLITGITILMALSLAGCSGGDEQEGDSRSKGRQIVYTDTVTFVSTTGDSLASVGVAVADEENERNMGLMDVNNLPADKGMLFIFPDEQIRSFWMANTPLPLDIIFVNAEFEIVRIHRSTQPFSEKSFPSGDPAQYVVEVNAGFCVSHDIQEGMRIAF